MKLGMLGMVLIFIVVGLFARYWYVCDQEKITQNAVYVTFGKPVRTDYFRSHFLIDYAGYWTDNYTIRSDGVLILNSYREPKLSGGYDTIPTNLTAEYGTYIINRGT